ncbi:hypothetical protein SDC49_11040 [Lactobacillus sp. R2/2]|nr:hypothetical protein [Lactobacillus sp. R2/2]
MVAITGLQGVPMISKACDLPQILVETVKKNISKLLLATLFV